jgi:uncharacterized protein YjbI with pentapeptide repeats
MANERGITSDEGVVTEGGGEAVCPIWMFYGRLRCRRKLHIAPEGVDDQPVCLMHSKDPRKQSGPLFDAFWLEFERILEKAGEGEAHFEGFVFPQLLFYERQFRAICRFTDAIFTQEVWLVHATFTEETSFFHATFEQKADFSAATFTKSADFMDATFTQDAVLYSVIFEEHANFAGATFKEDADFRATFKQDADFREATFMQLARFVETSFFGTAYWQGSRFLDRAEFRSTRFEPLVEGEPSAVFALARFSKPGEIVFDEVDLSRVLFHSCDVSQVCFTSSVSWGARDNNRGLAVFDETKPLEEDPVGVWWAEKRDYRAVAQIYQQLKKNYDSRLDYWTANEFHFSEMEMKRLAGPTGGPILKLRRWLHRKLSLVALYRYASDYGNSYGKPILWLLGFLILFAALLPLPGVGLKRQGAKQTETYASAWDVQETYAPNLRAEVRLFGKGAITSVDTATFQKSAEYAPAYPWGRVLAIFETLLTSSLFALFLLAIRRQFRR